MHAVLLELQHNDVVRLGTYSWQWKNKRKGLPSLANPITSRLFQLDLVTEQLDRMLLNSHGHAYIKVFIKPSNENE